MMTGFIIKSAMYPGYYVADPSKCFKQYTREPRNIRRFATAEQAEADKRNGETVVTLAEFVEEMFK